MMKRGHLRLIGDVHGKVDWNVRGKPSYMDLIGSCEYSIQQGDMGDGETYAFLVAQVDAARHRFFAGNHDDYHRLPPHCLGDFGRQILGGIEFFFVRGAYSPDKELRIRQGIPWWKEEELDEASMAAALQAYGDTAPKIVLSHTCPAGLAEYLYPQRTASRTESLLQRMFDVHQPELWVFGHFHVDRWLKESRTWFRCLDELSWLDLEESGIPVESPTASRWFSARS